MQDLAFVLRAVNVTAMGLLAFWSLHRFVRLREAPTRWFGMSFALLFVVGSAVLVLPEDPKTEYEVFSFKIAVASLIFFPYLLFRFGSSFNPYPRTLQRAALLVTLAMFAWILSFPRIPGPFEPRTSWLQLLAGVASLDWTLLTALSVWALVKGSKNSPPIARWRGRMLGAGAFAMNALIVLEAAYSARRGGPLDLATRLVGTLSALLFACGFYLPRFIRRVRWSIEQQEFGEGLGALLASRSQSEVLNRSLPHILNILSATKVTALDSTGSEIVSYQSERTEGGEMQAPPIELDVPFGKLVLYVNAFTPLLGSEEIELVKSLANLTSLAMERAALFSAETQTRVQLMEAQEVALLGSWHWEVGEDRVTWSDQLYRIFGLDPSEFVTTFEGFLSLVHPHDREMVRRVVTQSLSDGLPFSFEHRIARPDGTSATLLGRGRAILDEGGKVIRMLGVAQDISERKEAESRKRRLAALVSQSDDAIYSWDLEQRFTSWNPASERLYGYTEHEALGQHISVIIPPELRERDSRMTDEIRAGRHFVQFHTRRVTKNGARIDVSMTTSAIKNGDEVVEISAISRDVTEQLRLEAIRDDFISNAAHELRTPLTSIFGLALTLRDEEKRKALTEEDLMECFNALARQGERARNLINNLLEITQLDLGKLPMRKETVSLESVIRSLIEDSPPPKGKSLSTAVQEALTLETDPWRLKQILGNLVTNAYRYGGSNISIEADRAGSMVLISVSDDGPGIDDSFIPHLFESFRRSEEATRGEGSGLGLAICTRLARALGGSLTWDRSASGTKFLVSLPSSVDARPASEEYPRRSSAAALDPSSQNK